MKRSISTLHYSIVRKAISDSFATVIEDLANRERAGEFEFDAEYSSNVLLAEERLRNAWSKISAEFML